MSATSQQDLSGVGAELVFDAWRPFEIWLGNFVLGGLLRWGFWRGQELEGWGTGIRLLDERFPFQYPEPRMRRALQMHLFPFLATAVRIVHYQLGKAAEPKDN